MLRAFSFIHYTVGENLTYSVKQLWDANHLLAVRVDFRHNQNAVSIYQT